MNAMLRIIFREIVVLLVSLATFPVLAVALLVYTGSVESVGALFSGMSDLRRMGPGGIPVALWSRLIAPYVIVQAIRAFRWSQRSREGRRWANLYFCAVLTVLGIWTSLQAWDLLYFMYAMGDLPQEILQFLELEAVNLAVAAASFALGAHCFAVFLDPGRGTRHGEAVA